MLKMRSQEHFLPSHSSRLNRDSDGLNDWEENVLGSASSASNSLGRPVSYDENGDGTPDGEIAGDQAVFLERFANRVSLLKGLSVATPTRTEASRLLLHGVKDEKPQCALE